MTSPIPRSRAAALWLGAVVAGTGVLLMLAVRADAAAPDASIGLVALDVAVGFAFVVAASIAPGPLAERALVLGVGIAWLVGSSVLSAGSLHQAVLAIALIAFPSGRIRGPVPFVLVAATVPVALGLIPQLGVASLFAVVAGWATVAGRAQPAGAAYVAVSAAGVAAALVLSWLTHRFDLGAFDPTLALVVYQSALLLIAAAFPFAARAAVRAPRRLADDVVSDMTLVGLEGVAVALREALGDPSLRVYAWDPASSSYADDRGRPVDEGFDGGRFLTVDGADGRIAAVAHHSDRLDDAPTASAVASAVRLAVTNVRLLDELQGRQLDLEASRARLLAAADRARAQVAADLREQVETSLEVARGEVSSLTVNDPKAEAALRTIVDELEATGTTIEGLVMNVPPADLGGGRIRDALADLVRRSAIPVSLAIAGDVAGTAEVEATLYYVISEALANAIKHAGATRIAVTLDRRDGAIVASISDDGRGGADPSGSGLQGLADRLAVRGGRLRVESPPGAGTTVIATIPC